MGTRCASGSPAGIEYLDIVAEPNAEGLYLAMGAERIGQAASGSIRRRVPPLMRIRVPARANAPGRSLARHAAPILPEPEKRAPGPWPAGNAAA